MGFRTVIVSDEVTQVAPYNSKRSALTIINAGGATCYLSNNRVNVTSEGLPLEIGGIITFSRDRYDHPEEELNAQCLTGLSADVRIYESFEAG